MIDRSLGIRDKNGVEIHDGDTVRIWFFDRRQDIGRVHYDKANAAWKIGEHYVLNIGRDQGTTLEVQSAAEGKRPVVQRRKGKAS